MSQTDAELLQEPGSTTRYYEITFVDGSVHHVTPGEDHDVSALGSDSVIVYAPGRRTIIPWHRVQAVTLYGWDSEPD